MTESDICPTCGNPWPDVPLCYGAEAPWRALGVEDAEFRDRVELSADQCIVDDRHFFIRGHIDIPVIGSTELFSWSVWCSLSEKSFWHASKRWRRKSRENDEPYFGWLMTQIPVYPNTLHLETSVKPREVGRVPLVTVERPDHPLTVEQQTGLTPERVREIAHMLLHGA
jgi:hypothetical protein